MRWHPYMNSSSHPLKWRYNERDGVSYHQPHDCLLNRLFRRRSKKTSKLCVTGLCGGNSPVTGEFSARRASNAENISIWWRHHVQVTMSRNAHLWVDCFMNTNYALPRYNCLAYCKIDAPYNEWSCTYSDYFVCWLDFDGFWFWPWVWILKVKCFIFQYVIKKMI